ncbi:MAG: chromate resistance protein [Euryarchaeota archaeon]|nr:chromate resistance protein [Euryarchaeota archaeon]
MKWVTREHVHVDRTAIPWMVKRFIDPRAEFLFVPVEKIDEVVKKENAIPYDAPGVELGHKGEKCSFDAIIVKHKLTDPALLGVAKIVRGADTGKPELAPEAPGLDSIMTGMSIVAKDDFEAIKNAAPVYDALYNNCKLDLLREKHKGELEQMDRKQRREFLRNEMKER